VLLLAGGWLVIQGRVTIGALVAMDGYAARLIQPIREVHHLVDLVGEGFAAAERIFELLDTRPTLADGSEGVRERAGRPADPATRGAGPSEGNRAPGALRRRRGARIVLENVSFRYD